MRSMARTILFGLLILCLPSFAPLAVAQTTASSSAAGEELDVTLLPLLGSNLRVTSGPLPTASGNAAPPYSQSNTAASVSVNLGALGRILQTGVLTAQASSTVPNSDTVSALGRVDNANVGLGGLLTLTAGVIQAKADITGTCGSSLSAVGTTTITNASTGGLVGIGVIIPPTPAPNTVLLDLLGIKIVLNEQALGGNGTTTRSINMAAIHISLNNPIFVGLGVLSGDIFLGEAQAQIVCGSAPPASANLSMSATDSPDPATTGSIITYVLTVTNSGPSTATSVVVTDVLPAGTTFSSATSSQGSCSGSSTVTCTVGTLASGASATITVKAIANTAGTLVNTASATSAVPDPSSADNTVVSSTTVNGPAAAANLALSVIDSPDPVSVGSALLYGFTVTNVGPSAATNVVLTDALPSGASLNSASASQGSCSGTSTVTCSLGTIAAGSNVKVHVQVIPNRTGTLVNTATVSSPVPDPSPADNSATASTTVNSAGPEGPEADLTMSKVADVTTVLVGGRVNYTLTVTNNGPASATSVVITDSVPSRASFVSVSTSKGTCSGTQIVTCNIGSLGAGANAVVKLAVRADSVGTLVNSASVQSPVSDPFPITNTDTATVTVRSSSGPQVQTNPACRIDVEPAATLLIPYFEVDLDNPRGVTTLFSINNSVDAAQLAHVTVWTEWAVPSLTFDVYLSGYDVQTINLRDILNGHLPATGSSLSPGSGVAFPGCRTGSEAAAAAELPFAQMKHVQAWHTGHASQMTGTCASALKASAGFATGYVTVDVANRCSSLTPADAGYFGSGGTGVAGNANTLWGDFIIVDSANNYAMGDTAVHIKADDTEFKSGDYTFYGRYVSGTGIDNRQPLGTSYATRYMTGGAFSGGTRLFIWRDTKSPASKGVACGGKPAWGPLTLNTTMEFDEDENATAVPACLDCAPWATQSMKIGDEIPAATAFGWMKIDLWHGDNNSILGDAAQGWVMTNMSAEGRFSVGYRAARLDSACDF